MPKLKATKPKTKTTHHLVLGSSGLVGSELVRLLKERGHMVAEFDIKRSAAEDLRIIDNKKLQRAIKTADMVYFLAFDVGGSSYLAKHQHSFDYIQNNLKIMSNTFELLQEYKRPFIFLSSQMSNMNNSPYGTLKLLGDQISESLGGVVVKLWNVYGQESDPEKTHVIADFIKMAHDGFIRMRTDGEEERQFLHVRDCCECLYLISRNYASFVGEKELHLTSFKWAKIIEIAEVIRKYLPCEIARGDKIDTIQDRKNHPSQSILRFWQPGISLEEGIKGLIYDHTS
jgi:nucleoside-diphosphate-sugar epimerase